MLVGWLTMGTGNRRSADVKTDSNLTNLDHDLGREMVYGTRLCYVILLQIQEQVEVESKVLSVGTIIGIVSVELRNKETGKILVHTCHSRYFEDGSSRSRL
ncbi:acyl-coenzyme A thioesterase 13 [Tripterygium wilfordii]|uniref:Acyl-coenzyme A thioesterase 13 n=1 Tax=Tripterygium wilfordii TaxID=458696 RepID=A0A7J7DFN2_TRIWF|nr:uncharacterized protein LOC120003097 [Tripterygium wilfordii]XP_038707937.1 uncharacterized protein LOC120003097 [Tripterygium wilfordii]KAF5745074.1 acyl-coenzyme A thioesterase 13 [Tripterygium wilfordii]